MKSAIIYNLYPKNHWKTLTLNLLNSKDHEAIFICVSLDTYDTVFKKKAILRFLLEIPKVREVYFVKNNPKMGEVIGFNKLRKVIQPYDIQVLTYMHSKGVTKPHNDNIKDWVELMRYFLIERYNDSVKAFEQGYVLYGANLAAYKEGNERYGPYQFSDFHYSGNFVSVNLAAISSAFFSTPCDPDYFGVEGFWGKLCDVDKAFCTHMSSVHIENHYKEKYPARNYKENAV